MPLFYVVARVKTETDQGTKYRVKLKAGEEHTLTLVSDSSEIFKDYPIGYYVEITQKGRHRKITIKATERTR